MVLAQIVSVVSRFDCNHVAGTGLDFAGVTDIVQRDRGMRDNIPVDPVLRLLDR